MIYSIQHIVQLLKRAREQKGLSQKQLAEKIQLPQGHISKIENGLVDIRLSSLIEIARVLEMEMILVPKSHLLAVNSILSSNDYRKSKSRRAYIPDEDHEDE